MDSVINEFSGLWRVFTFCRWTTAPGKSFYSETSWSIVKHVLNLVFYHTNAAKKDFYTHGCERYLWLPINIYLTVLKPQSCVCHLQPSETVWLSTLTWEMAVCILVNEIISLDTKFFSSCLVQTKGKFDLLLLTVVQTIQFVTFREFWEWQNLHQRFFKSLCKRIIRSNCNISLDTTRCC